MDRSSKQKINKEIPAFNDTVDQMDIVGIYRPFYPRTPGRAFFSSVLGTFSRVDHLFWDTKLGSPNSRRLKSHQPHSPTAML